MDMSTTRADFYRVEQMLHRTMENMDDLELAFAYVDYMDHLEGDGFFIQEMQRRGLEFTDLEQLLINYYDN